MLIHENHGLSISFIACQQLPFGEKGMCCRFCFCCGHKACYVWSLANKREFILHACYTVFRQFLTRCAWACLGITPTGLGLWAYIFLAVLLYGPAYNLLCHHGPAYYFVMLFYGPTYYFAVLLWAYILFCCVTIGLHIILLCYYRPAYYFAVLLWACMLLCWMLLSNQIFDIK